MIRFMRSSTYRRMSSAITEMQDDLLTKSLENTRYASGIYHLQTMLTHSDDRVTSLTEEIRGRDEVIQQQEDKLEAQATMLNALQTALDNKSDRIAELDRRIHELYEYHNDHETRRAEVEARRGFLGKLLGRFG